MKASEFLSEKLSDNDDLQYLFTLLFEAVRNVSDNLDITTGYHESVNIHDEQQLAMDVQSNIVMKDTLCQCHCVGMLASEEEEDVVKLDGNQFSVAFDPLDGSSLMDANLAIGTICAIFPGMGFVGRKCTDMVGALMAVYGPRTTVIMSWGDGVHEFILKEEGFVLKESDLRVDPDGKYFAPGNLRAAADFDWYRDLVNHWIEKQYTLRYSGGMCPDVNHIFVKGSGIFTYPANKERPSGKLRLLYECAPMAYLMENAGGKAVDHNGQRILEKEVTDLHERTPIFIGSCNEVDKAIEYLPRSN